MSATLGRSPSRDSRLSVGISSPLLGINRDLTPPVVPEPGIAYLHDRLSYLESQISDIRSVVLTKDNYVERRNREDQHIRREFEGQKSALEQIDVDLTALKTEVIQVKNNLATLTHETTFLRKDVDRIEKVVEQLQVETKLLRVDVGECRNDITHLSQKMDSRFDKVNTRFNKLEMRLGGVSIRVESMDFRMKQSEKVRFNSLALQANSPISAVPKIDDDGKVCYPEWFPKTVIRFWGLRKPSRREYICNVWHCFIY
jgi:archaellum component FlaC